MAWVGGNGVTEKIWDSHPFSQTHPFLALSQTKTHTQSPGHRPRATHRRPPSPVDIPKSPPRGTPLENSARPCGEGYIYSKGRESDSSRFTVFCRAWGEVTLHPIPSSPWHKGLCHYSPARSGSSVQTPGLGVGGGGRERRRGRLLQARHKETSFSLGSMATLGRGQCAPNTSFPTWRARDLGGHSPGPGLPGLGPRGRRGRGPGRRLGFRQPGPGGLRAPQPWAGMRRAPRGAQSPGSWSFEGGPEASCW